MEPKSTSSCCSIESVAHSSPQEKWLQRTSRLLRDNEWEYDRHLLFDGSSFPDEQREEANWILLSALLDNHTVTKITFRNVLFGMKSKGLLDEVLLSSSSSSPKRRKFLKTVKFCNLSLCSVHSGDTPETSTHEAKLPKTLFENMDIEELVLEDCEMSQEECQALGEMIRHSKALSSLTLSNLKLPSKASSSSSAFDEIAKALETSTTPTLPAAAASPSETSSSLRHLDLSRTRLAGKNLSTLCKVLQSNTALEALHLDDCGIGGKDAWDLATFLSDNDHLKELSLCSNELNGESIRVLVQNGLHFNSVLSSLSLCQNPIGDDGAIYLTDLLCHHRNNNNISMCCKTKNSATALTSLSVSDCEIWSRGYGYMAKGVARMNGLQSLMVDGTEMEEHGEELLHSLRRNMTLSQLILSQSSSIQMLGRTNPTWREIGWYLDLNRIGKRHILLRQDAPLAMWPQVLQCSTKHPDYLYYMLRHKPELVQHQQQQQRTTQTTTMKHVTKNKKEENVDMTTATRTLNATTQLPFASPATQHATTMTLICT